MWIEAFCHFSFVSGHVFNESHLFCLSNALCTCLPVVASWCKWLFGSTCRCILFACFNSLSVHFLPPSLSSHRNSQVHLKGDARSTSLLMLSRWMKPRAVSSRVLFKGLLLHEIIAHRLLMLSSLLACSFSSKRGSFWVFYTHMESSTLKWGMWGFLYSSSFVVGIDKFEFMNEN